MKYLPIIDELFSSDSFIIFLIGLALSLIIGIKVDNTKKDLTCIAICFVSYVICEIFSNIQTNYLLELIALFIGTCALGGTIGFLVGLIVTKIKK